MSHSLFRDSRGVHASDCMLDWCLLCRHDSLLQGSPPPLLFYGIGFETYFCYLHCSTTFPDKSKQNSRSKEDSLEQNSPWKSQCSPQQCFSTGALSTIPYMMWPTLVLRTRHPDMTIPTSTATREGGHGTSPGYEMGDTLSFNQVQFTYLLVESLCLDFEFQNKTKRKELYNKD